MNSAVFHEISEGLGSIPLLDAHTHLVDGKLGARGLHDILLYHMAVSDLYGAGCPTGARLTEYPGWPSVAEARQAYQGGAAVPEIRSEYEYLVGNSPDPGGFVRLGRAADRRQLATPGRYDSRACRRSGRGSAKSCVAPTFSATAPSTLDAKVARTKTFSNMPWSGHSSRDASGVSLIRHCTRWNAAGVRLPKAPVPSGPGGVPPPSAPFVLWTMFTPLLTITWTTSPTTRFYPPPRIFPPISI